MDVPDFEGSIILELKISMLLTWLSICQCSIIWQRENQFGYGYCFEVIFFKYVIFRYPQDYTYYIQNVSTIYM